MNYKMLAMLAVVMILVTLRFSLVYKDLSYRLVTRYVFSVQRFFRAQSDEDNAVFVRHPHRLTA